MVATQKAAQSLLRTKAFESALKAKTYHWWENRHTRPSAKVICEHELMDKQSDFLQNIWKETGSSALHNQEQCAPKWYEGTSGCEMGPWHDCHPFWFKQAGTSRGGFEHPDEVALANWFVVCDLNLDGEVSLQELQLVIARMPELWEKTWSAVCVLLSHASDSDVQDYISGTSTRREWESSGDALLEIVATTRTTTQTGDANCGFSSSFNSNFWLEEGLGMRHKMVKYAQAIDELYAAGVKKANRFAPFPGYLH